MRANKPCFRLFLAELALPGVEMGPLDLAPLRRDISARDSGVVILLGIWILTSAFPIPVEHGGGVGGGWTGWGKRL